MVAPMFEGGRPQKQSGFATSLGLARLSRSDGDSGAQNEKDRRIALQFVNSIRVVVLEPRVSAT